MRRPLISALTLALVAPLALAADSTPGRRVPAAAALSVGRPSPPPRIFNLASPAARTHVIVEFTTPAVAAARPSSTVTFAHAQLHARLRDDLSRIDAGSNASKRLASSVEHEYALVFSGAAVSIDRDSIPELERLSYVKRVVPDSTVRASLEPGIESVGAQQVWSSFGTRGEGVTVAVIDSGVDYTHPALGGGIGAAYKVVGGWDFVNDDSDPIDDNGHGTHVAGIVAANSDEILGVAPDARLVAFKVLDDALVGSESDIIAAIERCADPNGDNDTSDRVQVVNMSLGGAGSPDDPQSIAVNTASALGITFCIAAGNNGDWKSVDSPGTAARAITVGAVDEVGALASFSSRGPVTPGYTIKPDVVAPGVNVRSAWPGGTLASLSGTSMATPHVAGIAALLCALQPGWSSEQIKDAIVTTSHPLDGSVMASGAGFVDAFRAASVRTLVEPSTINFGMIDTTASTWSSRKTFVVLNAAGAVKTYALRLAGAGPGLTVVPSTTSFTLEPGESREVNVTVRIDNARVAFPDESLSFSGAVTLDDGVEPVRVPWSVVKGLKLRVDWSGDESVTAILGADGGGSATLRPVSERTFETLVSPGIYTLTALASHPDGRPPIVVTFERLSVETDQSIVASSEDAPHTLSFRAADENGTQFVLGPEPRATCSHSRLLVLPDSQRSIVQLADNGSPDVRTSTLTGNFAVVGSEFCVDDWNHRYYGIQYETLRGVNSDVHLDAGGGDLLGQGVDLRVPLADNAGSRLTLDRIFHAGGFPLPIGVSHAFPWSAQRWNGVLYLDSRRDPTYEYRTRFRAETVARQPYDEKVATSFIRRDADGVRCFDSETPSPTAYLARPGESLLFGRGSFVPVLSFADEGGVTAAVKYLGHLDEEVSPSTSSISLLSRNSTVLDTRHDVIAIPDISARPLILVKAAMPEIDGIAGKLESLSRFESLGSDRYPPTLTSMILLDGSGVRLAGRAPRGSTPRMRFSAIDGVGEPASAKVRFRTTGTVTWHNAQVEIVGSDYGEVGLGHAPRGTIYEARLNELATTDGLYDLWVQVEDSEGNTSTTTMSPFVAIRQMRNRPVRR